TTVTARGSVRREDGVDGGRRAATEDRRGGRSGLGVPMRDLRRARWGRWYRSYRPFAGGAHRATRGGATRWGQSAGGGGGLGGPTGGERRGWRSASPAGGSSVVVGFLPSAAPSSAAPPVFARAGDGSESASSTRRCTSIDRPMIPAPT